MSILRSATLMAAVFACCGVSWAENILFSDDFSNGALGTPVSINDPDPQGNPETIADNTSITGRVLHTFSNDQRPYAGSNSGGGDLGGEVGGIASWGPGNGSGSGTFFTTYDFATNPSVNLSREFTVYLDDLDPVIGGIGTGGNWAAISLFRPNAGNGSGTIVNNGATGLGILFRDSGLLQVFSGGGNILGDTSFDSMPMGQTYDVEVAITNISGFGPGNSFDYDVIVDGSSITNGTLNGVDTSFAHIALETRTNSSSIGGFTVTSIPEPSTIALASLGLVGLVAVRRRIK